MNDVPVYYWDSCLFYKHLKGEAVSPTRRRGLQDVIAANERGENHIMTSAVTALEVIPEKLGSPEREATFNAFFDGVKMTMVDLNANILSVAREIRSHYYRPPVVTGEDFKWLDLGDAVHLATAITYNVGAFHTRDNDRKGRKVPLLDLYKWAQEDMVCGRYRLAIASPEADQGEFDGLR